MFALTYVASMFFPALSAVFKERIFKDAKEKLGGKDLDLFAGAREIRMNVRLLSTPCMYEWNGWSMGVLKRCCMGQRHILNDKGKHFWLPRERHSQETASRLEI